MEDDCVRTNATNFATAMPKFGAEREEDHLLGAV
jgi:hypothetical protein